MSMLCAAYPLAPKHAAAQSESAPPSGEAAEESDAPPDQPPMLEPETVGPVETGLSTEDGAAAPTLAGMTHKLILHPYASLPSFLLFTSGDTSIAEVRALITLDGELLALPMRFRSQTKSFVASFPTPVRSLRYQFQVLLADGRALVSEHYTAPASCERDAASEAAKAAKSFPGQAELLSKALTLDKEEEVLQYVINSIDAVLKARGKQ